MIHRTTRVVRLSVALALGAFATGCASRTATTALGPTAREHALLEDLRDLRLDDFSAVEAALLVGGPRDVGEVKKAVARLDAALGAIARDVRRLEPRERPRALLKALYTPRDRPALLRRYVAGQTVLARTLEDGTYNCVSATLLYLLAAARVGVSAVGVLMPLHARAAVIQDGRHIVVETTSPWGFDPAPEVLKLVRAQTEERRDEGGVLAAFAEEKGAEVDFSALLAAVYLNLAIRDVRSGELARASDFAERGAALARPEELVALRRTETASFMQLAAKEYDEHRLDRALAFAKRAYEVAPEPCIKAMAERQIAAFRGSQTGARPGACRARDEGGKGSDLRARGEGERADASPDTANARVARGVPRRIRLSTAR